MVLLDQEPSYVGHIKHYDEHRGWGHIECEDTFAIYGKDIFLLRSELHGVIPEKGDKVYFSVTEGNKGMEAMNVSVESGSGADALPVQGTSGNGRAKASSLRLKPAQQLRPPPARSQAPPQLPAPLRAVPQARAPPRERSPLGAADIKRRRLASQAAESESPPAKGQFSNGQPDAASSQPRRVPRQPGPQPLNRTAAPKVGILRKRVMAPKLGSASTASAGDGGRGSTSSSSRILPLKQGSTSISPAKAGLQSEADEARASRRRLLLPPPHLRRRDANAATGLAPRTSLPRDAAAGQSKGAGSGGHATYEGTTPKASAMMRASLPQADAVTAKWEFDDGSFGWQTNGQHLHGGDSSPYATQNAVAWEEQAEAVQQAVREEEAEEEEVANGDEAWWEEEEAQPAIEEAFSEDEWEPWPEEGQAWPLPGKEGKARGSSTGLYSAPSSKVVRKLCADLKAAAASSQAVAPLLKRLHVWLLSQWVTAVQVCIEEAAAHHALVAPLGCLQDSDDRDAVWACKVIGAAGCGHDGNAWAFADAGAIDAICSLIEEQPSDAEVQRAATYALGYLAQNPCIRQRLASSGAVGRVLRSVELNTVEVKTEQRDAEW